jgi:hypothetical protein
MSRNRFYRSAYAGQPPKVPALQAVRLEDPQAQKAIEALREHVEVLNGSRASALDKAVTMREFDARLAEVFRVTGLLKDFNGGVEGLKATPTAALPGDVRVGGFVLLDNGDLYFGASAAAWKRVTLT